MLTNRRSKSKTGVKPTTRGQNNIVSVMYVDKGQQELTTAEINLKSDRQNQGSRQGSNNETDDVIQECEWKDVARAVDVFAFYILLVCMLIVLLYVVIDYLLKP